MNAERFGTEVNDEETGRVLFRLAGSRVAVFADDLANWNTSTIATRNIDLLHSEVEATLGHVLVIGGHDPTWHGINHHPAPCAAHLTEQAIVCSKAMTRSRHPSRSEIYKANQGSEDSRLLYTLPVTDSKEDKYNDDTQRNQRRIPIRTSKAGRLHRHSATFSRRRRITQPVQILCTGTHGSA
jgi:hypothetical protein